MARSPGSTLLRWRPITVLLNGNMVQIGLISVQNTGDRLAVKRQAREVTPWLYWMLLGDGARFEALHAAETPLLLLRPPDYSAAGTSSPIFFCCWDPRLFCCWDPRFFCCWDPQILLLLRPPDYSAAETPRPVPLWKMWCCWDHNLPVASAAETLASCCWHPPAGQALCRCCWDPRCNDS